jgi:lysophospholipase L1-like esterase
VSHGGRRSGAGGSGYAGGGPPYRERVRALRSLGAGRVLLVVAVLALVGGIVMVVVTWPSGRETGASGSGRPIVAAFIGDSYTVGFAASTPDRRWTSLVAKAEGWEELNFGEAGSGYITKGFGGTSYLGRVEQVVKARPDVVFVAGGQNDASSNADVAAAVRAILLELRQGLPDAKIYVLGPTWPDTQPPAGLLVVEKAARDAAAEVDARFIPALDWLAGRPELIAPDGIHPNDAGHQEIANGVIAALGGSPTPSG